MGIRKRGIGKKCLTVFRNPYSTAYAWNAQPIASLYSAALHPTVFYFSFQNNLNRRSIIFGTICIVSRVWRGFVAAPVPAILFAYSKNEGKSAYLRSLVLSVILVLSQILSAVTGWLHVRIQILATYRNEWRRYVQVKVGGYFLLCPVPMSTGSLSLPLLSEFFTVFFEWLILNHVRYVPWSGSLYLMVSPSHSSQ